MYHSSTKIKYDEDDGSEKTDGDCVAQTTTAVFFNRGMISVFLVFILVLLIFVLPISLNLQPYNLDKVRLESSLNLQELASETIRKSSSREMWHIQRGFKYRCLFGIMTNFKNLDRVLTNFHTYDPEEFHLQINFYENEEIKIPENTSSIFYSHIRGFKPIFWHAVAWEARALDYEYTFFMDDDFVFSTDVFHFAGLYQQARFFNSTISAPNIIVPDFKSRVGRHKGTYRNQQDWHHFAIDTDHIETDAFMMKNAFFIFFMRTIIISEILNSGWGPDCLFCSVAKFHEDVFGPFACLHSPPYGLYHLNLHSLTQQKKYVADTNYDAIDMYRAKWGKKYNEQCQKLKLDVITFDYNYLLTPDPFYQEVETPRNFTYFKTVHLKGYTESAVPNTEA